MPLTEGQIRKELYEFGPFQVDPQKQTLLRDGQPIGLTPKAFQVLLVLVRRSNQIVSKDELMKAVWPDTFVEETNLTRNIFSVRRALGETEGRRYIITAQGAGYRLAEDAHLVAGRDLSIIAAAHPKVLVADTKPWRRIGVAAIVLLAATLGAIRLFMHRKPVLSEKDTVVLADFSNSTLEPVFDETLRQGMAVQLEQSPFLSLIPEARIHRTLLLMGQPADAKLTREVATQVCMRTGSIAVLEGSIASVGSQYVLGLRAVNCHTGRVLDEEQAQAARNEDVLNALTQIAARLRARVGESVSTIEKHDVPLAEATTASLEALKAYSTGLKVLSSKGSAAALPLFKRATEIDRQFAMAYAYLGRVYGDMGESDLSAKNTSRAYELRDHANDQERFFIAASYDTQVSGNIERAEQTCQLWAQTYPREMTPHALLGGLIFQTTAKYEDAAEEAQKTIELDPDFAIGYDILTYSYESLDKIDEAKRALQRAYERKLEIPWFLLHRYRIAFLQGNITGMEGMVAEAQKSQADEVLGQEGFVLAYAGQLKQARTVTETAADLATRNGKRETAALWEAGAAVREGLFGNASEAKKRAAAALELSKNREVEYGAALALALSGEPTRAGSLARDLEKRFPEDTSVLTSYLPTLAAVPAINHREPAKAIDLLQIASPYQLGVPRSSIHGYFGALYPIYMRGTAYLAEGRGVEAAREFKKILDHRGIVISDPIGPLAQLQLGRSLAVEARRLQGSDAEAARAKANTAYQDFLTLWKNADADIPVLRQAKAEYAKLR